MAEGIKVEVTETIGSKVEEPQKAAPVAAPVKAEEPKYVRIEDLERVNQSIKNTREYNDRKLNEISEKLEKLIPKPVEKAPDDLDELVQKDWKAGVRGVARELMEEERHRASVVTEEQKVANLLADAKNRVMTKHPELNDPESPKAKEFLKVLDENPDFRTNPRGPLLAAYEMENRLKGHDTIESKERPVDKQVRAKAASVPAGTSPGSKGSYSLSKADMDFCRHNNINPENYKRFRGQKEARA